MTPQSLIKHINRTVPARSCRLPASEMLFVETLCPQSFGSVISWSADDDDEAPASSRLQGMSHVTEEASRLSRENKPGSSAVFNRDPHDVLRCLW